MQITSQKAPQNTSQITSQNTSHSLFEKEWFKKIIQVLFIMISLFLELITM